MSRALISGGTGFVGSFLVPFLLAQGAEVFVFSRLRPGERTCSDARVRYYEGDICDEARVRGVVAGVRPDQVYHLAAISSVPQSWKDPRLTFTVNALGTANLFDALVQLSPPPRVLNISSGQVYGSRGQGAAIFDESTPLRPSSPYATSKVMAEALASQYVESAGAWIVTARPFNQVGPDQPPEFVLSSFARQFARIEAGQLPPVLRVGNLEVERDFTDVRDVIRAFYLLLQKGRSGEIYNVCSGHARKLSAAIAVLQDLTACRVTISVEPERIRPNDLLSLSGNPGKLQAETGWVPAIAFENSVRDLLEYWRRHLDAAAPQADVSAPPAHYHSAE